MYIANCYDVAVHIVTQNSIDLVVEEIYFTILTDIYSIAIVCWKFSPINKINIRTVAISLHIFNKQF